MNKRELVDRYMEYNRINRVIGNPEDDIVLFMPYLLLDIAYQYYRNHIKDMPADHELAKHKNKWVESYTRFNKTLSLPYTPKQYEGITDLMDDFEQSLEHDIFIAHVQCQNIFANAVDTKEDEQYLAAMLMMNHLANIAQHYWKGAHCNVHKTKHTFSRKGVDNPLINALLYHSREMSRYYKDTKAAIVSEHRAVELVNAVRALTVKSQVWAKKNIIEE